jgi:protein-S-isoprenylcysteine O-methyltransferase Ste14
MQKDASATDRRKKLPLFLTLFGGLAIGGFALWRLVHLVPGPGRVIAWGAVCAYVFWKIWETRVSVAESTRGINHDQGTLELCAMVEMTLLVVLFVWGRSPTELRGLAGILLFTGGLYFRLSAVATLGRDYSLRIRELAGAPVNKGVYGMIRHPAYLGTLLIHGGMTLIFFSTGGLVMLAAWFLAVGIRTRVEDRFLMADPAYRAYADGVRWRWLPGIY